MQRKLRITVEGVAYEVLVEDVTERVLTDRSQRALRKVSLPNRNLQNESEENRVSPMNGVVVEILVGEGDMVEIGDSLLTVESMKIVNTLTSHRNGIVSNIAVKVEQSVKEGQTLLTIL